MAITLLPWIDATERTLMRNRAAVGTFQLDPDYEGLDVPNDPCAACTIVQWCGTPQGVQPVYDLTTQLRAAWQFIATTYNEAHPDFPLRHLDCMLVFAMFVAGEIDRLPDAILTRDCADHAELFARYVRLIQQQLEDDRRKQE